MNIMRSQGNMMWIDMPHYHVTHFKPFFLIYKKIWSRIVNFSQHAMTKIHVMIYINNIIIFGFS